MITIREERPEDIEAIAVLNQQAFGQAVEAELVNALRSNDAVLLSLVAILDKRVVGHVLYTPVSINTPGETIIGAGLGPMAVLPALQRKGIGSKLVESGNRALQQSGYPFIVVLGHAGYYPRFGFRPAILSGLECEWEVPAEVFMVLVFDEVKMQSVSGLVKYRAEFSSVV